VRSPVIRHRFEIAPSFAAARARATLAADIGKLIKNVDIELDEAASTLQVLGPKRTYLSADPFLEQGLRSLVPKPVAAQIGQYRCRQPNFDFCLDDCWTGWFIASADYAARERGIVLIHLDDHTDTMSTLLWVEENRLTDAITRQPFDPFRPDDWESAIDSGAILIGSFITPFFHTGCALHVRHLTDRPLADQTLPVDPIAVDCAALRCAPFAAISVGGPARTLSSRSYRASTSPAALLADLPDGVLVIHIDLDYFINDLDGDLDDPPLLTAPIDDNDARARALAKLDRFFEEIERTGRDVEHWIVAASPGFCCARHWDFLLGELNRRIGETQLK
jgi:hypothetical protein